LLKDIVRLLRDIARLHRKNKIVLSYLNEKKQFSGFLIQRKIYEKVKYMSMMCSIQTSFFGHSVTDF